MPQLKPLKKRWTRARYNARLDRRWFRETYGKGSSHPSAADAPAFVGRYAALRAMDAGLRRR